MSGLSLVDGFSFGPFWHRKPRSGLEGEDGFFYLHLFFLFFDMACDCLRFFLTLGEDTRHVMRCCSKDWHYYPLACAAINHGFLA